MTEAERLANILANKIPSIECLERAAAELRRLSAEVERLTPFQTKYLALQLACDSIKAENDALRKLLQSTRAAMVESMRFYGQSSTNWTHMIAAIDAALAARPGGHS